MAKTHQNAEKFPIQWDGDVTQVGKDQQNDNIPSNVILSWGTADVTWGDVNFIQEIMDGIGSGSRRTRQDRLNKLDDNKKKKLIHYANLANKVFLIFFNLGDKFLILTSFKY